MHMKTPNSTKKGLPCSVTNKSKLCILFWKWNLHICIIRLLCNLTEWQGTIILAKIVFSSEELTLIWIFLFHFFRIHQSAVACIWKSSARKKKRCLDLLKIRIAYVLYIYMKSPNWNEMHATFIYNILKCCYCLVDL